MQKFIYYAPTEIVFGRDTEKQTAEMIKRWGGSKVLIVYGGGSVIDTAKGIAVGAANSENSLWDIWTGKTKVTKALPVGVILTISAAGSEMSSSAVLTNEVTWKKSGFGSELNRPKFAIMNPKLTYTIPKYQLACEIVDIMMHTMERYFTTYKNNQLTDEIAEGLLRTVIENGRKAYKNQEDYDAMSELMWAGSLSHNDLTGLGRGKDFTVHKFGHELSAMFDVAHGASLSAIWGTWARSVYELDIPRFKRFGEKVWKIRYQELALKDENEEALAAISATEQYFKELQMPICIGELSCGVLSEEVIKELAEKTTNYGTIQICQFKKLDIEDVYKIYKKANHL